MDTIISSAITQESLKESLKEVITDNQTNTQTDTTEVITSPLRAIRLHCLDCCCGQMSEVRNCPCTKCFLYPFRMGNNPYRKRELTDEQKQAARDRLAIVRAKASKSH